MYHLFAHTVQCCRTGKTLFGWSMRLAYVPLSDATRTFYHALSILSNDNVFRETSADKIGSCIQLLLLFPLALKGRLFV